MRPDLDGIDAYVVEGAAGACGWESLERWLAEGPATPPAVEGGAADPLDHMSRRYDRGAEGRGPQPRRGEGERRAGAPRAHGRPRETAASSCWRWSMRPSSRPRFWSCAAAGLRCPRRLRP